MKLSLLSDIRYLTRCEALSVIPSCCIQSACMFVHVKDKGTGSGCPVGVRRVGLDVKPRDFDEESSVKVSLVNFQAET